MKVKLILALGILMTSQLASAQFAEHALGLRVSGDDEIDGIGAEISYQYGFYSTNRGELDLGFHDSRYFDVVKLTGIYQWVWNIEGGLNWFAGPGIGLGIADYGDDHGHHHHHHGDHDDHSNTELLLSLDGDIGLEYIFEPVPLQLALDVRPEIYIMNDFGDNLDIDVGFAIRWQFR